MIFSGKGKGKGGKAAASKQSDGPGIRKRRVALKKALDIATKVRLERSYSNISSKCLVLKLTFVFSQHFFWGGDTFLVLTLKEIWKLLSFDLRHLL